MKKATSFILALVLFLGIFNSSVLAIDCWENYFLLSGITIGTISSAGTPVTFNPTNSSQRVTASITNNMITGFKVRLTNIDITAGGALQFGLCNSRGGWWGNAGLVFIISTEASEATLGDTPYGYLICQDMSNYGSGTKLIVQKLSNPVGDTLDISLKRTDPATYTFILNGQTFALSSSAVTTYITNSNVYAGFGVKNCDAKSVSFTITGLPSAITTLQSWENYWNISGTSIAAATATGTTVAFNPAVDGQRVNTSMANDINGMKFRIRNVNLPANGALSFGLSNSRAGWIGDSGLYFMVSTATSETTLGSTPNGYLLCRDMTPTVNTGTKIILASLNNVVKDYIEFSISKTSSTEWTVLINGQSFLIADSAVTSYITNTASVYLSIGPYACIGANLGFNFETYPIPFTVSPAWENYWGLQDVKINDPAPAGTGVIIEPASAGAPILGDFANYNNAANVYLSTTGAGTAICFNPAASGQRVCSSKKYNLDGLEMSVSQISATNEYVSFGPVNSAESWRSSGFYFIADGSYLQIFNSSGTQIGLIYPGGYGANTSLKISFRFDPVNNNWIIKANNGQTTITDAVMRTYVTDPFATFLGFGPWIGQGFAYCNIDYINSDVQRVSISSPVNINGTNVRVADIVLPYGGAFSFALGNSRGAWNGDSGLSFTVSTATSEPTLGSTPNGYFVCRDLGDLNNSGTKLILAKLSKPIRGVADITIKKSGSSWNLLLNGQLFTLTNSDITSRITNTAQTYLSFGCSDCGGSKVGFNITGLPVEKTNLSGYENYWGISGTTVGATTDSGTPVTFNPASSSQRVTTATQFDMNGAHLKLTDINLPSGGAVQFSIGNTRGSWWGDQGLLFIISKATTEATLGSTPNGYILCRDMTATNNNGTKFILAPFSQAIGSNIELYIKKTSSTEWSVIVNGQTYSLTASNVINTIANTASTYMGFGNYDCNSGSAGFTIAGLPSNASSCSNFENTWGIANTTIGTATASGTSVQFSPASTSQRVSASVPCNSDGINIKLSNININSRLAPKSGDLINYGNFQNVYITNYSDRASIAFNPSAAGQRIYSSLKYNLNGLEMKISNITTTNDFFSFGPIDNGDMWRASPAVTGSGLYFIADQSNGGYVNIFNSVGTSLGAVNTGGFGENRSFVVSFSYNSGSNNWTITINNGSATITDAVMRACVSNPYDTPIAFGPWAGGGFAYGEINYISSDRGAVQLSLGNSRGSWWGDSGLLFDFCRYPRETTLGDTPSGYLLCRDLTAADNSGTKILLEPLSSPIGATLDIYLKKTSSTTWTLIINGQTLYISDSDFTAHITNSSAVFVGFGNYDCGAGSMSYNISGIYQTGDNLPIINNSSLLPKYVDNSQVVMEGNSPDWVKTLMFEQFRVEDVSRTGTFKDAIPVLDHLAETGINAVWISPPWQRADSVRSGDNNGFGSFGPCGIDQQYTGTADINQGFAITKDFVDEAHARNIRVFFDIVSWGVTYSAPVRIANPSWFTETSVYQAEGRNCYLYNFNIAACKEWFISNAVNVVAQTGIDGFRCDLEPNQTSSYLIFNEIRSRCYNNGYKIALFSEQPNERYISNQFVYDFEQVSAGYTSSTWIFKSGDFYLNNNIVDSVKNGYGIGKYSLQPNGGQFRFYTYNLVCHDSEHLTVFGNRVSIGYQALFSPFIPFWYIGEEWNNPENKYIQGASVFCNTIDWKCRDIASNRRFLEDVKKMIKIRRKNPDIFNDFPDNHRNAKICAVSMTGNALQSYARYYGNRGIMIIPNNTVTNVNYNVSVPLNSMGISSGTCYKLTDLMTGKVIGYSTDVTTLKLNVGNKDLSVIAVDKLK